MKNLVENSIDSLVTDPPAGISFMGKEWDSDKGGRDGWIKWMTEVMTECKRVLKPGAHGLIWAIPRTSHWTATALEDAGFEVRDVITHLFGSGFPKSLDVSKAIDKAAGAEREVIGKIKAHDIRKNALMERKGNKEFDITAPATDSAKQWQGWGTALKPASEHWILVRKPCSEKTVAANVQKHGTGAINIDASRIEGVPRNPGFVEPLSASGNGRTMSRMAKQDFATPSGRFPANLVLSHSEHCTDDQCDIECAIKMLDEQSGRLHLRGNKKETTLGGGMYGHGEFKGIGLSESGHTGASRFFYCAKISTSERNAGLDDLESKDYSTSTGATRPNRPARLGANTEQRVTAKNHHPTVKPKKLMSYLIRMITPPGGTVLDPFMGSGSTGIAAKECGFNFIGIEKEEEYFEIASKRIEAAF